MKSELYTLSNVLKFLLPSLLGAILFILPLPIEDGMTIPAAVIAGFIVELLGTSLVPMIVLITVITAVMSLYVSLGKPTWAKHSPFVVALFKTSPAWLAVRLFGATFAILSFFEVGPEAIYNADVGHFILFDLLPTLFAVFIFAGLVLPLLLNYGLLEFIGTLLTKIMRPLFNLPGRSAIDSMASWLGDGSVGILLTSRQYEDKHYTEREAVVIGTTFSAVSITFSLVVIAQVGLEHMFGWFYLCVCIAGFVCALIVPRLFPLRNRADKFIDGSSRQADDEHIPEFKYLMRWAKFNALSQAQKAPGAVSLAKEGVRNAVDMVFGVLPVVMGVGTAALLVAYNTPIFDYLGLPFIPLLELLQIPEAEAASRTFVVGFADMFIPSILAGSIESELTRFVIAAVSVTQLIYMSEVGALMMGSKIPVKLWELFVIFLLRTLVSLPIIAGLAHLIF
nr:YjiH family protein [Alginatibacterium sediminis]